jgi:glycerol-3-phosphate O-acyltransferase
MLHNPSQVLDKPLIVTTRAQLKGYGLTRYQATKITQDLTPISKQGRTYIYLVSDAIGSIRTALTNSRLKSLTRQQLLNVLDNLLARLDNVIILPFDATPSSHPEIGVLAKQLLKAISNTNTTLVSLKATAATINGKYKK